VHSFNAANNLLEVSVLILKTSSLLVSSISDRAATAFATTMGLESESKSRNISKKPWLSTSSELISQTLATQIAAVLRTYGSESYKIKKSIE